MTLTKHISKTFMYMALAVFITFLTAFTSIEMGLTMKLLELGLGGTIIFLIIQFGLVIFLTSRIHSFKTKSPIIPYLIYSMFTGVTLSITLMFFEKDIIYTSLAVTIIFFFVTALYGLVTKRDVTKLGSLLMIGLFVMIFVSFIGIFIYNDTFIIITSGIILLIFLGLVVYDTKKIKDTYYAVQGNEEILNRLAISSALGLYLDFINIFIQLLRIFAIARDRN